MRRRECIICVCRVCFPEYGLSFHLAAPRCIFVQDCFLRKSEEGACPFRFRERYGHAGRGGIFRISRRRRSDCVYSADGFCNRFLCQKKGKSEIKGGAEIFVPVCFGIAVLFFFLARFGMDMTVSASFGAAYATFLMSVPFVAFSFLFVSDLSGIPQGVYLSFRYRGRQDAGGV